MTVSREQTAAGLADRYDREAAAYEELWAPILLDAGRRLVAALPRGEAHALLDVGAGVGTLVPVLTTSWPGARVTAVDRSRGMLARAPRDAGRAVMDAVRLAIRTASVDRVTLAFMLFHLEEPLIGLREARRVLRAGGAAGSVTWVGDLESTATRLWSEALDALGAAPADPAAQTRHERVGAPDRVAALYREAGFVEVRAWIEPLVAELSADLLVALKTRMGSSKPRFDSLAPATQAEFLARIRERLHALAPQDFVARAELVFATGRVEHGA